MPGAVIAHGPDVICADAPQITPSDVLDLTRPRATVPMQDAAIIERPHVAGSVAPEVRHHARVETPPARAVPMQQDLVATEPDIDLRDGPGSEEIPPLWYGRIPAEVLLAQPEWLQSDA